MRTYDTTDKNSSGPTAPTKILVREKNAKTHIFSRARGNILNNVWARRRRKKVIQID